MMRSGRLGVLILASGCDATDVGEAWSTYQWVRSLSELHDITLLTYRKRGRPSAIGQLPGVRVVEWLDLPFVKRCDRFNSMLKPGYLRFYLAARRWIGRELQHGRRFDIIHQLSPLALRYPSAGVGWGVPFIVGPLGGSVEAPSAFASELGRAPWYVRLRVLDHWRLRHDPWLRTTVSGACVVIGVAPYVAELLKHVAVRRFEVMSETGVTALPCLQRRTQASSGQCRLLFVGRVIRTKGVRDAIRALGRLPDMPGVTFDIVGDGDDLEMCRRESESLGLTGRVYFHGRQDRRAVDTYYANADAFLFPSLREASGNVVLEAMSHGLPTIVADNGGPGFVVDDQSGLRVKPENPHQYAKSLATAICTMARNPALASAMGAAARQRIESGYLWPRKAEWMSDLYLDIIRCGGSGRSDALSGADSRKSDSRTERV